MALRARLPLGEPFADPGVGEFGLRNAVMALGDTFVEVVSPLRDGTAAGRFLDRRGDGGYMLIFQVDDLDAARSRAAQMGIREVWHSDLPDIEAVHLHPADAGGAIISLDRPRPPESWRWAGPDWTGRAPQHAPGGVEGAVLRSPWPDQLGDRWRRLLEGAPGIRFASGEPEGIEAFEVAVGNGAVEEFELAGVRFRVRR